MKGPDPIIPMGESARHLAEGVFSSTRMIDACLEILGMTIS
jgi:hypothetical protein